MSAASPTPPQPSARRPDLGERGVVAVMTPAENPTVEPELSVLNGPDVNLLTTRMYAPHDDLDLRLKGYARLMDRWLAPLGGAPLDAAVFACTGSSYLTTPDRAPGRTITHGGQALPLVAAANALEDALTALEARDLVIVTPYSPALTRAAVAWWTGRGFNVRAVLDVPPTSGGHLIYSRDGVAILETLRRASKEEGDIVVALGTGAPSLPALAVASLETDRPMLSSNLATAWALARALSPAEAGSPADWLSPHAPWRARLDQRFPRLMARLAG